MDKIHPFTTGSGTYSTTANFKTRRRRYSIASICLYKPHFEISAVSTCIIRRWRQKTVASFSTSNASIFPWGRQSSCNPFSKDSYSFADSSGRRRSFENKPCLNALFLLRSLPRTVRGRARTILRVGDDCSIAADNVAMSTIF